MRSSVLFFSVAITPRGSLQTKQAVPGETALLEERHRQTRGPTPDEEATERPYEGRKIEHPERAFFCLSRTRFKTGDNQLSHSPYRPSTPYSDGHPNSYG